jgi:hypothetical protein
MTRLSRVGVVVASTLAVAACVLGVGVSAARAASPSLTLSIQPAALTQGHQGFVQATFDNGGARMTGAAIFLTFESPVAFTPGNGCYSLAPFLPRTIVCPLGVMAPNTSATRYVTFTVPATGPVSIKGAAGYLSFGPFGAGLAKASASAPVYPPGQAVIPLATGATSLGGTSDCVGAGGTVSESVTGTFQAGSGTAGTDVTTGSSISGGLPCAPIITGVVQNDPGAHGRRTGSCTDYYTDVPNGTQVTVTLTFPDECLPWPANEAGTSPPRHFDNRAGTVLYEWPGYPDLGGQVAVPACQTNDVIPAGFDTCVKSVDPSDPDKDYDAGSITLIAVGTGGDPGYHGG